eukprot:CAMPEP_0176496290 /NCGR_PEP_ID=MMETSP0200_2-20121128/11115_1 /TAXON_ID=947934 /ORGANISM="Chaetoceros sp., Strain GSL56" /LENGTH=855 /DNA_ID=CAMNT_0017894233 /DNA_START=14 /DNA_END=2581 /DNA_ORIENTATION=+
MDFNLTTDIEAELLDWDDDETGDDDENDQSPVNDLVYDSNERECKVTSGTVNNVEDCVLRNVPTSSLNHTSSFDSNPQDYFTASTFTEQSPLMRQRCPGPTDSARGMAHDDNNMGHDQDDTLEPLYPPNFFFSGIAPWDPSQAVNNPNVTKNVTLDMAAPSNTDQSNFLYSTNPDSKMPVARASLDMEQQSNQQMQCQPSQASRTVGSHRSNAFPINCNSRNLAAAAAGSGVERMAFDDNSIQDTKRTITDSSTITGSSSSSNPSSFSSDPQINVTRTSSSRTRTNTSNQNRNNDQSDIPPFYLFDAPCELRTNFLQAQRQHEIATGINDSNSFHYGMAVNGFHPQVNAQVNPDAPDLSGPAVLPNGKRVELLDGRHKNKRKAIERNEREQQRAQKISDLIENLRDTMEQGGWKVEMKSKYQILSTSTSYLKHLIQTTKEKERNLQKAKAEVALRNQKLEEDKVLQDGRSDPESVTSSLTAFSSSESKFRESTEDSSTNVAVTSTGKRKSRTQDSSDEPLETMKKAARTLDKHEEGSNHDSNLSSGGNIDSSNSASGHDGKNISIDKMSSSLSDMTDSNRGSSDGQGNGSSDGHGNSSKDGKAAFDLSLLAQEEISDSKTESSISSTAAVVSGVESKEHDHRNTAIIFTTDRKRKQKEKTSIDDGFKLSYQEVFLSSNVPQMIATPAGRIVACNDFFFRVTGLTPKEVKKLTIFSMVQVDRLSQLFDLVADSLRKSNKSVVSRSTESSSKPDSTESSFNCSTSSSKTETVTCRPPMHFETITLPSVPFPQKSKTDKQNEKKILFLNVTFMYDENPSKRCIHCALTDKPGVQGKIGTISTDLLSLLFPKNDRGSED